MSIESCGVIVQNISIGKMKIHSFVRRKYLEEYLLEYGMPIDGYDENKRKLFTCVNYYLS